MAAGVKSPLAFWAGGAATKDTQGGFRSPLGFWIGGAGTQQTEQGGFRSLLAFWAGGASSLIPQPPVIHPVSGGAVKVKPRKRNEDEELLLILSIAMQVLEFN